MHQAVGPAYAKVWGGFWEGVGSIRVPGLHQGALPREASPK